MSTSPAASTARPERATTFFFMRRAIPAAPTADKRPPMVVGRRHTSSPRSTVWLTLPPPAAFALYWVKGSNVIVAITKITVSTRSKTESAFSFGVLRRSALSTIPMMRSIKASPGSLATRTMIQSLKTVVPAVTALASVPSPLTTGADSPVTADSFTLAMPLTTSPSAAMISPCLTRIRSPRRRFSDVTA